MSDANLLRPFRFGVLASGASSVAEWESLCARCEQHGYSSLLVPDHMNHEWGPLVSLTLAARATSTLRIGPLMLAAGLRSPSVVYKELATIDLVAPGRLEIGVGAGWLASDFARAGMDEESAVSRINRAVEMLSTLRQLWDDGKITLPGRFYHVGDAVGEPRPQPARWTMGGGGPQMLRAAARHADIISLSARFSSTVKESQAGLSARAAEFDRRVRWVLEATGDRHEVPEFQCLLFAAALTKSSARYADRVLARKLGLPPDEALDSPLALVGSEDEVCERLEERRKRFGISYWVLPSPQADSFAPVVARLAGK